MERNRTRQYRDNSGDWFDRATYYLLVKLPLFLLKWTLIIGVGFLLVIWVIITFKQTASHGDNLTQFIQAVRTEQYEFHGEFMMTGEKIYELTNNSPSGIEFRIEYSLFSKILGLGRFIAVHNHPTGNWPPSYQDLVNYTRIRPTVAIVVTQYTIYELSAPNGWPGSQELANFLANLTEVIEDEQGVLQYRDDKSGLIEPFLYPEVLDQMLDKFGLIYTETPVDDWRFD